MSFVSVGRVLGVCACLGCGFANVSSTAHAAALAPTATCGKLSTVRDYSLPLTRMAPVSELPESGKLPFGPRGLKIGLRGEGLISGGLIAGSERIGFGLSDEAVQQVRRLNWLVETELVKVGRRGQTLSSLGIQRRRLGTIEGNRINDFLHRVPAKPAFYRVDIRFYDRASNRLLGEYSAYARGMKPRIDLRVRAENWSVAPGETAAARLMNLGTVKVESSSYTYGFRVQAFTGERWITVPDNPPLGRVPKRMQILPAGEQTQGCLRYEVPSDQPPGLFRFALFGADGTLLLAAEFEVVPSG